MKFANRLRAGELLAKKLSRFKNEKDAIILGIPRGGVEVAYSVAKKLKLPLSIIVAKKISYPMDPEFAIGAASLEDYAVDERYGEQVGADYIEKAVREARKEVRRRYRDYIKGKIPELKDKIAIIVDDGLATGYTMLAAVKYAKSRKPKKVVAAVPVAAADSLDKAKRLADETICLYVPVFFGSVGAFYQDFGQLDDRDVKLFLKGGNAGA